MDIPYTVWITGGIALLVVTAVGVLFLLRSRKVNLTRTASPDEKPEWLRSMPPPETIAATQADGEGITLYDYDAGEKIAAPFAEQIEDILQTRLSADPYLAKLTVDLGTTPGGGLEIWVDDQRYTDVDAIPNQRLREAIHEVVKEWNAGAWEQPQGRPDA